MASSEPSPIEKTADVFLIAVYGAVAFFFLWRWTRHRRTPSIWIAGMASGWVLVAVFDLGVIEPNPYALLRLVGLVIGILLLVSVVRAERKDDQRIN